MSNKSNKSSAKTAKSEDQAAVTETTDQAPAATDQGQAGTEPQQQGPQFALQYTYVKGVSFESPRSPEVFGLAERPQAQVEFGMSNKPLEQEGLYEMVLSVTITSKNEAGDVQFVAEAKQAGVFLIRGFDEETVGRALGAACPTTLFPYVREVMDNTVVRGGFRPPRLMPINFEAVYAEMRRRAAEGQTDGASADAAATAKS